MSLPNLPDRSRTTPSAAPSAAQLSAGRLTHWHQQGNPLLTTEAAREWLQRAGLVLYAPRPAAAAAPTFVEATLGHANAEPAVAELETARNLLAKLVADGSAVPLNLMGAAGATGTDTPDYVVSAQLFSYIFTLRGNKTWKQAPATSGAVKVSPLALAAYQVLEAKVTLTAYDLTTQLGKEVTEAAVLRALTELWSQLRVLPVPQADGSAALWELATARFTKQIKNGANAGQPSALSALASLYLGQALLATEDDIETFLSPLASRSRVRDVVHALLSARQLESVVIAGKTLLHLAGEAPVLEDAAPAQATTAAEPEANPETDAEAQAAAPRIGKFRPDARGSQSGAGGMRARPFARPGGQAKPAFGRKPGPGSKPGFGRRPPVGTGFGPPAERDRRPFARSAGPQDPARPPRSERPSGPARGDRPDRPGAWRSERRGPGTPHPAGKPGFGRPERDAAGNGRAAGKERFEKPWKERRPAAASDAATGPARSAFAKFERRPAAGRGDERPARRDLAASPRPPFAGGRTFSKPGTFGRKREQAGGKAAYDPAARPPRRSPQDARSGSAASDGSRPARPPFTGARAAGDDAAPRKVYRKFDAPRGGKSFPRNAGGGGAPGGFSARPPGRTARPADSSDRGAGRPPFAPKPGAGRKPFARPGEFEGGRGGFGSKPFASNSAGSKPAGPKPGSSKFGSSKFGSSKPASARSFGSKAGGPRPQGGFKPTPRQRPEEPRRRPEEE